MVKRIINVLIFAFIFALYVISFLMIFESFKKRKLEILEASAIDTFEKSVKIEKVTVEDIDNDKTSNMGLDYNGYTLLGRIEIPSIGFSSVIIKENTYHAMDLGVVMSYGDALNEPGGYIISGHNFRGGSSFFYGIKNLDSGDKVYITDSSGRQLEYTVYEKIRNFGPTDTSIYKKYDGYHLTLVTCENGGASRIVIKASAS
jgi:LPXTG-site transpeptidase (sortase) family protein